LFKNHNKLPSKNHEILNLENILSENKINSVLYSDPFLKIGFAARLVQEAKIDVLYFDLDLLYSGYVKSGMLPSPQTLTLLQPAFETIDKSLTDLVTKLSLKKSFVIVDSLNGLFNMLNKRKEVGRVASSYIMLISSIAQITNSYVVIASMVRFKKEEGWILSPTGKRLIEANKSKKILLEKNQDGIIANVLNSKEKFVIESSSIPL